MIAEGVPEYEVSLACIAAGTRKAAEIIGGEDADSLMSPMIHNLQVLQSGHFTSYPTCIPRCVASGGAIRVYMCFCPIAHFKQFKLGYDREYFVGEVKDEIARIPRPRSPPRRRRSTRCARVRSPRRCTAPRSRCTAPAASAPRTAPAAPSGTRPWRARS